MKLSDGIAPQTRFSRSINVERDTSQAALMGYLPTGRALDVVRRIVRSLDSDSSGRAFSITGPHGSGKSSLAVFLGGLTAAGDTNDFELAMETLSAADPITAEALQLARTVLGAAKSGFVRCIVTANREPVTATVARALEAGARHFFGKRKSNPIPADWAKSEVASKLTPRDIRDGLEKLTAQAPVLVLVDEFGKNLEAYSDTGRNDDPFLLQELAEWAGGAGRGLPLVVITMQHLAFEEYVHESSTARRREWVKVQGRFEDIAYVESASQARRLVAAAFDRKSANLDAAIGRWISKRRLSFARAGLGDLFDDGVASRSFPLHPVALAALPELCSRYGQNERTIFSFLAGPEPQAVPAFLEATQLEKGKALPFVRLSNVYDYFVASAATMIASATSGGRWVEIETRIRDTTGLNDVSLNVLKSIGVLNLISAGGALRASRSVLSLAVADDVESSAVAAALRGLEDRGLVTYRDFADEYRIWQGSDFDLQGTIEVARRRCAATGLSELLNEMVPPSPLVASRHSQQHGTLRVFERRFSSFGIDDLVAPSADSEWDGRVLLSVVQQLPDIAPKSDDKPLVAVMAGNVDSLRAAAVEASALAEVLRTAESAGDDWVARREIIERLVAAQEGLQEAVEAVFESGEATWSLLGSTETFDAGGEPSRVLSNIADYVYSDTPCVPNEMIARRELTAQGSKARRVIIEGMLANPASPHLGIIGYPAERAMYEAILATPGFHVVGPDGTMAFQAPTDVRYGSAWRVIEQAFERATEQKVNALDMWRTLQAPPIGLKDGPIPILLIVALILRQYDVALYEHGTLVLALDDAVAERFAKNPGHFAVKNTAATSRARKQVVEKLAQRLGYASYVGAPTFLGVARRLFAQMRRLEPYTMGTASVSDAAKGMRKAFRLASEPDRLIFEELPMVFGLEPIPVVRKVRAADIDEYVEALVLAIEELEDAYPSLLRGLEDELARALAEPREILRKSFSGHASSLAGSVLELKLKSFVNAACRDELEHREWVENIAMIVADAPAPKSWNDETVGRFRLGATELGGAFRRVSALISERKALDNEQIDVVPVVVTRLDGREGRMVLWATTDEKREAEPGIAALLQQMAEVFGGTEKAREVLLASLLDGTDEGASPPPDVASLADSIRSVQGG